MPELLLSIPITLLILLACHEAGRITLRIFQSTNPLSDPLENSLLRLAAGFVTLEFVLTLLASSKLLNPIVLWILLIALLASAIFFGRKEFLETCSSTGSLCKNLRELPLNGILTAVAALALLMDFVLTCVPTTAWDALTYHYPLPMTWLGAGGFVIVPGNAYNLLPCATEMLYAFAFGLGGIHSDGTGIGPLAANHLTWVAGLFSCIALVLVSRRFGGNATETSSRNGIWNSLTPGLIAAVAFLSLPIVYVEEMEGGYIENFLVFLSLVMFILLLDFKEKREANLILLIGLLAGGLLASKHTSVLLNAIILVMLIVWIARSPAEQRSWKTLLGAILITLLIPYPWYLKSYSHTGDPVWPFLTAFVKPDAAVPDIMYWSNPNVDRSIWGFITYIPRLTWDESLVQVDFRLLSWYFLPLLPFAIYWSIAGSRSRIAGLITWILIILIYILAPGEPRYMLVAWCLYAALGAWGLLNLLRKFPWITRLILPILLLIPIGLALVDRTKEVRRRVPTIIGLASVDEYFEKSFDIHSIVNFVNHEVEPDATVLMVEPRIHYIEQENIVWYPFPTYPIGDWGVRPVDAMLDRWENVGIGYVVVTYGPNYRALAIAEALRRNEPESERPPPLNPDLPSWVFERADYAEKNLHFDGVNPSLDEDGTTDPSITDRFDVSSMLRLTELHASGNLEPVFIDERAGIVFRVVYPEEDGP